MYSLGYTLSLNTLVAVYFSHSNYIQIFIGGRYEIVIGNSGDSFLHPPVCFEVLCVKILQHSSYSCSLRSNEMSCHPIVANPSN